MKLFIATRNRHKLDEIKAIFQVPGLDIVSALDFPDIPDVLEDGKTFESNAIKKAVTFAMKVRLWTLADDSGLEVAALQGEPGVRSARYAGEPVDYHANNVKLLEALKGKAERQAHFRCVVALSSPSGRAQFVEGRCEGIIIETPRGQGGFGYDPVFVPKGHERTFAEMEADAKNSISHRGKAFRKAMEDWSEMLAANPADWPKARKPNPREKPPRGEIFFDN